jgi:hypothetical protein
MTSYQIASGPILSDSYALLDTLSALLESPPRGSSQPECQNSLWPGMSIACTFSSGPGVLCGLLIRFPILIALIAVGSLALIRGDVLRLKHKATQPSTLLAAAQKACCGSNKKIIFLKRIALGKTTMRNK